MQALCDSRVITAVRGEESGTQLFLLVRVCRCHGLLEALLCTLEGIGLHNLPHLSEPLLPREICIFFSTGRGRTKLAIDTKDKIAMGALGVPLQLRAHMLAV